MLIFKKLSNRLGSMIIKIIFNSKNKFNFGNSFNPQTTLDDVLYAYRLFLKRHPDIEGLQHHKKLIEAGLPLNNLVSGFLQSTEYKKMIESEEKISAIKIGGSYVYAQLSDKEVGYEVIRNKQYEPHVTKVISKVLREGDTFVDIGANIGFFTMLGASIVGNQGKVIAVEPKPDNIQLILAGIVKNGFSNVHVLPYAASEFETIFELVSGGSNACLIDAKEPTQQSVYTQSIVLDDQLAKYQNISMVKLDVEGHEFSAVKGFKNLLRKFLPTLITEFHPKLLIESGNIEPEAYLSELFELYKSVSIILSNGDLKRCYNKRDIMQYWIKLNDAKKMGNRLHMDLIASA